MTYYLRLPGKNDKENSGRLGHSYFRGPPTLVEQSYAHHDTFTTALEDLDEGNWKKINKNCFFFFFIRRREGRRKKNKRKNKKQKVTSVRKFKGVTLNL